MRPPQLSQDAAEAEFLLQADQTLGDHRRCADDDLVAQCPVIGDALEALSPGYAPLVSAMPARVADSSSRAPR